MLAPLSPLHRVVLALGFALLALLALRDVSSLDVGFHLRAGEHILDGHGFPQNDPFSFTMRDHAYVDTTWGYQVTLAALHRMAGAPGIVLFHALLVLCIFVFVFRSIRLGPADPTLLVLLLIAGGIASELRFEARPEILSYAFLAGILHLLHRRAAGLATPLWILPLLFVLWANMHALFVLGFGAIGCCFLGESLRRRHVDRPLLKWGALSVAAVFINPYGWRGAVFPFTLATRFRDTNVFSHSIGEFVSPFDLGLSEQMPFFPELPLWTYRALAVLSAVALIGLVRRKRWTELLLWAPFFTLSAMMIRNLPLFAVACLPGTVFGLSALPLPRVLHVSEPRRTIVRRALLVAVGFAVFVCGLRVLTNAWYIDNRRVERFGLGWNRQVLPLDAAEHAKSLGLDGPMLNHLNFGGTLMFALAPAPVFIDGRLEVVGERFYGYYQNVLSSTPALEECVTRYGIEWTIFPYATFPKLLQRVSQDPKWRLTYVDGVAVVFVRSSTKNGAALDFTTAATPIDRLPGIAGNPRDGAVTRWFDGLLELQEFPADDFNRGLFHYYRGELDPAQRRFAAAIQSSRGRYFEMYSNLGAVLYRKKEMRLAADCYRVVLEDEPENRLAKERLAAISATTR